MPSRTNLPRRYTEFALESKRGRFNDIKLAHLPSLGAYAAMVVERAGFRRQVPGVGARQHRFDTQQLVIVVLNLGREAEIGIRIDIVRVRAELGILRRCD